MTPITTAAAYESARKATGLTDPKLAVLLDLEKHGDSSCDSIASRCAISGASLRRYLGDLRRAGHITRGTEPEDFRKTLFSLSERGREVVAGLLATLVKG